MSMSNDLTARLLAEIERREGIARAASPGPWTGVDKVYSGVLDGQQTIAMVNSTDWAWNEYSFPATEQELANAAFIAANDPPTTLAYLAALREIVELHTPTPVVGDESRFYCPTESYDICAWPCPTIKAVARALDVTPDGSLA